MSALNPGLYRATVRGVPDVIVMSQGSADYISLSKVNDHWIHWDAVLRDARPLIVLDLVSSQVDYLRHALNRWIEWSALTDEKRTLDGLLDQIEAQTKPARIPEPGLWGAIVEAHSLGAKGDRLRWVKGSAGWTNLDATGEYLNWISWDLLIDPILIREGVTK